jgi:large subunit ribosomal protein L16
MLMPRKVKHRKEFRGRIKGIAQRGYTVSFGKYALKSIERGRITARQIEAARRAITRYIKRGGKIWIRIFPAKPVTSTPPEVGMGGGKGAVDHYEAQVKPGTIIFEMDGVPEGIARQALRLAAFKLSVKTKFIIKGKQEVEQTDAQDMVEELKNRGIRK